MNTTTCSVFVLLIGTLLSSAAPLDEAQALIHDIRMLASAHDGSSNDCARQTAAQATMAMERIMSLARDHEDVASLLVAELTNAPVDTSSARRRGVVQAHGAIQGALSAASPRAYLTALSAMLGDPRWDAGIIAGYITTLHSYLLYRDEYAVSPAMLQPILGKAGTHPHKDVRVAAAAILLGRKPNDTRSGIPPVDRALGAKIVRDLIAQASDNHERAMYYDTLLLDAGLGRDEYTNMLWSAILSEDDPIPFVTLLRELGEDTHAILDDLLSRATPSMSNRIEAILQAQRKEFKKD